MSKLFKQIANGTSALVRVALHTAAGNDPIVPKEAMEARSKICDACVYNSAEVYLECGKCYCYLPLKVQIATETCPAWEKGEPYSAKEETKK